MTVTDSLVGTGTWVGARVPQTWDRVTVNVSFIARVFSSNVGPL